MRCAVIQSVIMTNVIVLIVVAPEMLIIFNVHARIQKERKKLSWCYDFQYNYTQHNDTRRTKIQHNNQQMRNSVE
jgi:hypothetical protein